MKIVSKKDVIKYFLDNKVYSEDEIEVMFAYHKNHPIIQNDIGDFMWMQVMEYDTKLGNDPNQMISKYIGGEISQEEYMNYNRQIGYSFLDIGKFFALMVDLMKSNMKKICWKLRLKIEMKI